jgi:hypothetical protein
MAEEVSAEDRSLKDMIDAEGDAELDAVEALWLAHECPDGWLG